MRFLRRKDDKVQFKIKFVGKGNTAIRIDATFNFGAEEGE
jgi:hypothetical protein